MAAIHLYLENERATTRLAQTIAKALRGGETIALTGDLGAGKTTFVKALLAASGVRKTVTSPTFVLMVPYRAKRAIFYHLDLYRTGSFREVEALGVTELWNKKGNVVVIEWADKIRKHLPKNTISINLAVSSRSAVSNGSATSQGRRKENGDASNDKADGREGQSQGRRATITNAPQTLAKMLKYLSERRTPQQ